MTNANDKLHGASAVPTTFDLAGWGAPVIAYVRHTGEPGAGAWSIHSADGTRIGVAPDRATAMAAARQHDLEPVNVH